MSSNCPLEPRRTATDPGNEGVPALGGGQDALSPGDQGVYTLPPRGGAAFLYARWRKCKRYSSIAAGLPVRSDFSTRLRSIRRFNGER